MSLEAKPPIVEFRNVSICFDERAVLKDVSFRVEHGETRILLGPAGVGKSVLLKLADGLLQPDKGEVLLFGRLLSTCTETEMFELRARIGMVFQESALFDSLNVEDNVSYRLHEEHVPEAEAHERVVEALRFVELERAIAKFPSELSGGMRRRVSIARAIISHPELILYDSPTGGLDPITSTTIIELVVKQRFNQATGHMEKIPDNGVDESTRFLVLNEGRVVFDGDTRALANSTDPWLKSYIA
jgi:phospholipid/cholesterol/gamma-HCH transport system ATP-binding protein